MNRVGERRHAARASGSAGSCTRRSRASRRSPRRAATPRAPQAWRDARRARCSAALERDAWDGALVPARATSTTARRSAPRQPRVPDRLDRAVLGGAVRRRRPGARARRRWRAVDEHLVKRARRPGAAVHAAVRRTRADPGYIQGYPPGVRENGGQYTHAARLVRDGATRCWATAIAPCELFSHAEPDQHAPTRGGAHRYKIEPYVVAGDVYSEPPHVGRGGWSWYTGSAGWLYRAGIEYLLGIRVQGAQRPDRAVHPARLVRLHGPLPARRRDVRDPRRESAAHFVRRRRHRRRRCARSGRPFRRVR